LSGGEKLTIVVELARQLLRLVRGSRREESYRLEPCNPLLVRLWDAPEKLYMVLHFDRESGCYRLLFTSVKRGGGLRDSVEVQGLRVCP